MKSYKIVSLMRENTTVVQSGIKNSYLLQFKTELEIRDDRKYGNDN